MYVTAREQKMCRLSEMLLLVEGASNDSNLIFIPSDIRLYYLLIRDCTTVSIFAFLRQGVTALLRDTVSQRGGPTCLRRRDHAT